MSESIDTVHLLNHALNVDMSRMKSLSNNSANISSSGYKAEIPIVTPFEQMMPSINMETLALHRYQKAIEAPSP